MPKVVFITLDGAQRVVDANVGESVMAAAVRNGIPGIIGECGGNCSCATCHVYVDDDFSASVGGAGDMEDDLLDLGVAALPLEGRERRRTNEPGARAGGVLTGERSRTRRAR